MDPVIIEQDLARFNVRFQLPMDLRKIEALSGLEYLGPFWGLCGFLKFLLFLGTLSKLNTAKYCVVEKTLKSYYEEKYRVNCKKLGMKKRELLEGMKQILGDLAVPLYKRIVDDLFKEGILIVVYSDILVLRSGSSKLRNSPL